MSTLKATIGELILRARSGEELALHEHDEMVRAYAEELLDDWEHGSALSEDGRDFLMYVLQDYVFPGRRGRPGKTAQARDYEGAAINWGKQRKKDMIAAGHLADVAAERAAGMVLTKFPELQLAISTVRDRINRLPHR